MPTCSMLSTVLPARANIAIPKTMPEVVTTPPVPANAVVAVLDPVVSLPAPLDNSPVLRSTLSTGSTTRDTNEQIALAGQSGVLLTSCAAGPGIPTSHRRCRAFR
jgi:hypothetical protein